MTDNVSAPHGAVSLPLRLFRHIIHMPAWHRHVLTIAAALAAVGIIGHVRQHLSAPAPQTSMNSPNSGFAQSSSDTTSATDTSTPNAQPWYLSPQFLNVGGSVLGGFLIGWLTRTFVKTVTLVAALGAASLAGLSYFHVMNVDFTAAHQQYDTAMNWLSDQAWRLKDVAIAYLPVHAGGLFGAFLGFRRR